MIVYWKLRSLPEACADADVTAPLLVASRRWAALDLRVRPAVTWREVPFDRIGDVRAAARGVGGVIALGGGSAIDLGKAFSAETGLPLVSVPTTYSGAEWTSYFGVRDGERRMRGGGAGAHPTAIVYEPELTLQLPTWTTVGTAMNALAHCAEALYVERRTSASDENALAGARLIAGWLPRVVASPDDRDGRTELLRGAARAGAALAGSGLALAHALAQAVGGRYGLAHGTVNGICLPPVLRFNAAFVPDAVRHFGEAIGAPDDPAALLEELAGLGGPIRLRDLGVPEDDLPGLAAATAGRGGNLANPKPASPDEIEQLLREAY